MGVVKPCPGPRSSLPRAAPFIAASLRNIASPRAASHGVATLEAAYSGTVPAGSTSLVATSSRAAATEEGPASDVSSSSSEIEKSYLCN